MYFINLFPKYHISTLKIKQISKMTMKFCRSNIQDCRMMEINVGGLGKRTT